MSARKAAVVGEGDDDGLVGRLVELFGPGEDGFVAVLVRDGDRNPGVGADALDENAGGRRAGRRDAARGGRLVAEGEFRRRHGDGFDGSDHRAVERTDVRREFGRKRRGERERHRRLALAVPDRRVVLEGPLCGLREEGVPVRVAELEGVAGGAPVLELVAFADEKRDRGVFRPDAVGVFVVGVDEFPRARADVVEDEGPRIVLRRARDADARPAEGGRGADRS